MNTTIDNNNELLNGLINMLAESITKKVMEKVELKIESVIEKKISDIDFEAMVDECIDTTAIAEEVERNLDLSESVENEVTDQLSNYDFEKVIKSELSELKFEVKISS